MDRLLSAENILFTLYADKTALIGTLAYKRKSSTYLFTSFRTTHNDKIENSLQTPTKTHPKQHFEFNMLVNKNYVAVNLTLFECMGTFFVFLHNKVKRDKHIVKVFL